MVFVDCPSVPGISHCCFSQPTCSGGIISCPQIKEPDKNPRARIQTGGMGLAGLGTMCPSVSCLYLLGTHCPPPSTLSSSPPHITRGDSLTAKVGWKLLVESARSGRGLYLVVLQTG